MFSCQALKKHFSDKNPKLSLIHLNIRSLRKNYNSLIAFLSLINHNFSFICLSETWLSPDDRNLYALSGYNAEYCYRATPRGGGSAVFIKSSLSYKRRNDLAFSNMFCESVWIEFDKSVFSVDGRNTVLGCIYRSPASSQSEFCFQFDKLLHTITNENKNIIICGDINVNIIDPTNQSCSDYLGCLHGYGFESLITTPTRCDIAGSNTLIDHILTNFVTDNTEGVIEHSITDHYPIFLTLGTENYKCKENKERISFNSQKFVSMVQSIDWTVVISESCAEKAYQLFLTTVTQCINECTTVHITARHFSNPRKPWVTRALLRCILKKNQLHKRVTCEPFNSELKIRVKKYSNTLAAALKCAKREYFQKKILDNGNDTRRNWQVINEFLNNKCREQITKIRTEAETYSHPTDIANAFSEYFSSTCESLRNPPLPTLPRQPYSFFLRPTSAEEVLRVITSLRSTGPGLDSVHPSHIKLVSSELSPVIADIVNKMFKAGIFPDSLKVGRITPVHKKGDRELLSNYRPICILPFFSKIIERLMHTRLISYLTKFNLLTSKQYGFRPGYSTELALLTLTDKIKGAIDQGFVVGGVFIDLTKAFDTINHKILIHKLESYGITGPALQFISSYLCNRTQVVQIDGKVSAAKKVNQGVPQGSILGPLLFLLFINDLPNVLTATDCILYADDTTIFTYANNVDELQRNINVDLHNISSWCRMNMLRINPSKTVFIVFHSFPTVLSKSISVRLDDNLIPMSDSTTFLGVVLDRHMKFNLHAQSLIRKITFGIRAIIKTRSYFQPHIIHSLYHAHIHSHLSYCISAWGNTYLTHLNQLQRLQNQALRLMTFSHFLTNATPLYQNLNIHPLYHLFQLKLSVVMYRLFRGNVHIDGIVLEGLVNNNITRFSELDNRLLPKVRTNYGKFTTTFTGIKLWNSLPYVIKSSTTEHAFNNQVKKYFLQQLSSS